MHYGSYLVEMTMLVSSKGKTSVLNQISIFTQISKKDLDFPKISSREQHHFHHFLFVIKAGYYCGIIPFKWNREVQEHVSVTRSQYKLSSPGVFGRVSFATKIKLRQFCKK